MSRENERPDWDNQFAETEEERNERLAARRKARLFYDGKRWGTDMPSMSDEYLDCDDMDDKRTNRHRQLRKELTEAEKAEALRIGSLEFKSAGAVRKR